MITRRHGIVRTHRAVPWRTSPHPVFAVLVLMALLVGIVIGIFSYHAPATEPLPSTSYTQTAR